MADNYSNMLPPMPRKSYPIPTKVVKTGSTHSSKVTYCSNWKPDTQFNVGDYFYFNKNYEYYYKCVKAGTTASLTHSKSGFYEPAWNFMRPIYDERIVWEAVPLSDIPNPNSIRYWRRRTSYAVGNYVYPTTGAFEFDGIKYAFRYTNTVPYPELPKTPGNEVLDGTVKWRCCVSIGKLLPKERRKEEVFIELIKCLDYLQLHEELHFADIREKYGNRYDIRDVAVKQVIGEYGYAYVSNTMNMDRNEIRYLAGYLSLISALKGSKNGLEMCLELLGMSYRHEEWWQPEKDEDKGEPDTWNLYLELDLGAATAHLLQRIVNFTRNYVYPVLKNLQITFFVNMAEMAVLSGGFIDKFYDWDLDTGIFVLGSVGGFREQHYKYLCMYRPDLTAIIISGGFIERTYEIELDTYVPSLLGTDQTDNTFINTEGGRFIDVEKLPIVTIDTPSFLYPIKGINLPYEEDINVVATPFNAVEDDLIPTFTEVKVTNSRGALLFDSGLIPYVSSYTVPKESLEHLPSGSVIQIYIRYLSQTFSSKWAEIGVFYGE